MLSLLASVAKFQLTGQDFSHQMQPKNNVKVEYSSILHDYRSNPYPAIHIQAKVPLKSLSQREFCLTKNDRITSLNC